MRPEGSSAVSDGLLLCGDAGYDAYIVNSNTPEHLERHVNSYLSNLKLEEWWNGGAKGARIVDVGAGTGSFTLALARRVAPYHRVLCVEPSESMNRIADLCIPILHRPFYLRSKKNYRSSRASPV